MDISERIRQKMTEHNLKAVDLTRMTGATKGSVSQWLNGVSSPGGKYIVALTRALRCDANWLFSGISSNLINSNQDKGTSLSAATKLVPIINHKLARKWINEVNQSSLHEKVKWEYTSSSVSNQAFWLNVIGDSMTSPIGPSISEGHLILVDPEILPKNGDLVVATFGNSLEVTFKKLVIDAGQKYLKPLNPNYRPVEINDHCHILGVVKEAKLIF